MTVLKVVALISGGKDSIYNCLEVLAENHEIVALANLHPRGKGRKRGFSFFSSFLINISRRFGFIFALLRSYLKFHSSIKFGSNFSEFLVFTHIWK